MTSAVSPAGPQKAPDPEAQSPTSEVRSSDLEARTRPADAAVGGRDTEDEASSPSGESTSIADPAVKLLFRGAMALALIWAIRHTAIDFSYDLDGHIRYLVFLFHHPTELYGYRGPEEHHPPFFYGLAALATASTDFLGFPVLAGARLLSLGSFAVFLSHGLRTLELYVRNRRALLVSAAVLCFWPLGLVMASRLTNDVALMACVSAVLFHLARHRRTSDAGAFTRAWLWACGALLVKSSGWVVWPLVGLALGGSDRPLPRRRLALLCGAFLLAVLANNAGWWFRAHAPPLIATEEDALPPVPGTEGQSAWEGHFGGQGGQPLHAGDFLRFPGHELLRPPQPMSIDGAWRYPIGLNYGVRLVSTSLFGAQATAEEGRTSSLWHYGGLGLVVRWLAVLLLAATLAASFELLRERRRGWLVALGVATPAVAYALGRWTPARFEMRDGFWVALEDGGPWWHSVWEPLVPVACILMGLLSLRRLSRQREVAWLVLSVGCFVAFSGGFTWWKRFDECADFRFVYATLIPLTALFGIALERVGQRRVLGWTLVTIGSAFVLASSLFLVLQPAFA